MSSASAKKPKNGPPCTRHRALCHPVSMKTVRALTLLAIVSGVAWAQAGGDSKPATSNVPGAQYPRIQPDSRVAFRVSAPTAQKVQVKPGGDGLGKSPYDMVRDDKEIGRASC